MKAPPSIATVGERHTAQPFTITLPAAIKFSADRHGDVLLCSIHGILKTAPLLLTAGGCVHVALGDPELHPVTAAAATWAVIP